MDWINKRPIPSESVLKSRNQLYEAMDGLPPLRPKSPDISEPEGLELGNKKTGESGKFFDRIFVFNLPVRITCPGASEWCATHCYNADKRTGVYPIDKWRQNWWWAIHYPVRLRERIFQQLDEKRCSRTAVRIHSCGDFFSARYIQMWQDVCRSFPNVRFWGYTRSWAVSNLHEQLIILSDLENVSLFASWDASMKSVPSSWRRSLVAKSNTEVKYLSHIDDTHVCQEQYGLIDCCASCAACILPSSHDIVFILH